MRRSKREADRGSRIADGQTASAPAFVRGAHTRQTSERGSSTEAGPGGDDKTTEIAAVRLLARREHSTRELKRKLQSKGHAQESVERVVDKLGAKELVSDDRFATSFVAHHGRRGHGPIRIRAELRQQGATDESIGAALSRSDLDWAEIASAVRIRKFGSKPPASPTERAKQSRFLQYRGFAGDHIRVALAGNVDSTTAGDDPDASFSDGGKWSE